METEKIYKRDANGGIRVWWAETNGEGSWRSNSGVFGGAITTSEWRASPAKSQADSESQAEFEALSQCTKLLAIDYRGSVGEVDIPRASSIKPMLAYKYQGWTGECYSQPKLDGMRCLANAYGLWSRGAKPIVAAPHVFEALKPVFAHHPELILDGELYNHMLRDDFNTIMSIVKRTIIGPEEIERSRQLVQYHIYDVYDSRYTQHLFNLRNWTIGKIFEEYDPKYCVQVETRYHEDEDTLDQHYTDLLENGYEGQIVRYDKQYEQKRSNYLLKRKEFITEEFELISIDSGEGNYSGFAKIANCKTIDGKVFGAGISGNKEYTRKLLVDWNLGKSYQSATIRYFNMTPDGIPRFPVALTFNDGALEDRKPKVKKDMFG